MSARHTRRGFLAAHHLAAKAGIPVPPHVAAGPTAEEPQNGDGRDRPWYRISNATEDEAELLLYDDIGGWFGTYAEDFDADLKAVTAKKLTVRVNSPGGSVFEGMAIASMLRAHPADITVRVDGIAASIASVIAMAGDRVVMMPGATMMIHDASGMCLGDAADMAKMAELLDLLSNNIADIYAAKAGGTRDEWRATMRAEKWYLAQEAVDAGLADEVASMDRPEPEEPEMRKAWDLKAYGYAGPEETKPGQTPSLTIDVAALLGEAFVEQLRATVLASVQPTAAVEDTACPSHNTAVEDGAWDAAANQKRLGSPIALAKVKQMYATYDDDRVEDGSVPKDAAHLPHHFVAEDGTPGAASVAGVRNALSRLPQTQGLSEAERSAAEKHLQAHLDRYNREHGSDDHVHDEPAAAVAPADDWAADVAALTTDPADDWAADLTHLTGPDASSSAATAA